MHEAAIKSSGKGMGVQHVESSNLVSVTIIGLGAMGSTLAKAFLNQGYPTTVWNRSANKADSLVVEGAMLAATVSEAVAASRLVIVCVLDYNVVDGILSLLEKELHDHTLVNLTNGTPDQARQLAKRVTELGADYLDGAIMAVPDMIAQPEASLLYSGSQDVFDTYQEELSVLGTSSYLGTDPGLASLYDLALLSGMYGLFAGFLQAVALVGTEDVKAKAFTALLISWLSGMLTSLPKLADQIDSKDYSKDVASNLRMQAVAYANIVAVSKTQGLSVDLLAPVQTLIARRIAEGHGADDISSLIELIGRK